MKAKNVRTLIIAKPAAVNGGSVSDILKMVEEAGLKVVALKEEMLDAHHLKKDIEKEKDPEMKRRLEEALKVPCVLISAEGKDAVLVGKRIKERFDWKVHVSASEEVGKYETARFFKKEEVFSYDKVGDFFDKMDLREKDFKGNFR